MFYKNNIKINHLLVTKDLRQNLVKIKYLYLIHTLFVYWRG